MNYDPNGEISIEVYGMRGERIISGKLPGNLTQHQLNLEGNLPGIYFIRVINGKHVGVERILKL